MSAARPNLLLFEDATLLLHFVDFVRLQYGQAEEMSTDWWWALTYLSATGAILTVWLEHITGTWLRASISPR